MTCSRHRSRRSSRTPAPRWRWTGRTWSPSPGPRRRHRRLRRPRGILGPPQEQPAAQRRRAVLRLLPLRRGHGARGERPRRPRARPPRPLSSCRHDPVRAFAPVLTAMPGQGIPLGDILDDSGYSHRDAGAWAIPLRAAGAPSSRTCTPTTAAPGAPTTARSSPTGTCTAPSTPRTLLELGPLARAATKEQAADWERRTAELARHKLGRLTADDADGYHRVQCPAAMGKIRCPLRPASMRLDRDRPEILQPPEHPPGLLRTADDHRPAGRDRQDRAKARLPVRGLAPLLRPPHRRRTRLRHRQGPRQQQHQPRLVPPHGPDTPDAVHHHLAHRPQPAHPGSLERPAGRKPAPRRRGPAPENPPTAPQDPRQPRRRATPAPPRPARRPHDTTGTTSTSQREQPETAPATQTNQKTRSGTPSPRPGQPGAECQTQT